jgi:site-specific DNA recombinase
LGRDVRYRISAERKLIASHLIKAVTLTRGYGIQIDFNISEAQYLNGMEL